MQAEGADNSLTLSRFLKEYLPLVFTSLFIVGDFTLVVSLVSSRLDGGLAVASLGAAVALALLVASLVLDIELTSTALSTDAQRSRSVLAYGALFGLLAASIHVVLAFTPAFGWVTHSVMRLPDPIVTGAREPFIFLLPCAPIALFKRYLFGLVIRKGRNSAVFYASIVRTGTAGIICWLLMKNSHLSSASIGAAAFTASLAADVLALWALYRLPVKPVSDKPEALESSSPSVARFHLPLLFATMLGFAIPAIQQAFVSRMPDSTQNLTALALGASVTSLLGGMMFSLYTLAINYYSDPQSRKALIRYGLIAGVVGSLILVVLIGFHLDVFYFRAVSQAPEPTLAAIHQFLTFGIPLPFLGAIQGLLVGALASQHNNFVRPFALLAAISGSTAVLAMGVRTLGNAMLFTDLATATNLIIEAAILAAVIASAQSRTKAIDSA